MRRTGPIAILCLLAACTVTTTGAPCTSDANCPSDQGCGSDRTCSVAALSCPGHGAGGECVPGTSCVGGQVLTCTATGGVCATGTLASCTDPGQSCVASGAGAACACPTSGACSVLDATRCSAGGAAVERCLPAAAGSACLTWQTETSCATSGLVCSASACVCPANPGPTFHADPLSGSAGGSPLHATGLASPPGCRFSTLTEALGAANARGTGSEVRAVGWTASVPGGTVLFTEPGGLAVGPGVSVTTDDAPATTSHYAVTTSAMLFSPLVVVGPGGSVTGFELRNAAATGDGFRTACTAATDEAPVTISTVRVAALSGGAPPARLATGVHVTGHCPVVLSGVSVEGASTGVLVESAAASVQSRASLTTLTGCTAAGVSVIEGRLDLSGGSVSQNGSGALVGATGTGAPSLSATGTTFSGNATDGIQVSRGTLLADACPFTGNGTHVRAQPGVGASVSVTVQNSAGAARMTGATDSAFRLLARGAGSTLVLSNNVVTGNSAVQSYSLVGGARRGGGVVLTAPFPGTAAIRGNQLYGNRYDQFLVAASAPEALSLAGAPACGPEANAFACYDAAAGGVGLYSGGAVVDAAWNRWTRQPGVYSIDVGGTGVTGYDTSACTVATVTCP